jgi:diguanylate cyclase (GGDEF)-like protein
MENPEPSQILIVADQETARRWTAMLKDADHCIWLDSQQVPEAAQVELVLTNRDLPDLPQLGAPPQSEFPQGQGSAAGPAVVKIGADSPADLRLPADVTGRELRLACRLVAEIVRLRRREVAHSRVHRRLQQEALTDPVTTLPNRRAWDQALHQRAAAAATEPGLLCVAILDLDHFKRINDAHGYATGDQVIRAAGGAISGSLRQQDFVARLGGDEFGLLLDVPSHEAARAIVDRVRTAVPAALAQAGLPRLTASAGVHVASEPGAPPLPCPDSLFAAADTALRSAKRQGRDRTVTHPEG